MTSTSWLRWSRIAGGCDFEDRQAELAPPPASLVGLQVLVSFGNLTFFKRLIRE